MSRAPIEVLVFDVFGTVVDWRGSLIAQLTAFFADRGRSVDPTAFADAWRQLYQPSMEAVRRGDRPWVPLDTLHLESLDVVLKRLGMDDMGAADRLELTRFWHRLDGWPDASTGLKLLRRQGFCCALSNGNVRMMADVARYAGLIWDQILGAEWSNAYKPEARVYLDAADAFMVPPAAVLMVAAHNSDLEAAAALGLQTAFVRRSLEHGPEQQTDLEPTGPWSFVADDLVDLAARLETARATAAAP